MNLKTCKCNQSITALIVLLFLFVFSVVVSYQDVYASEPAPPIDLAQLLRKIENRKPASKATAPIFPAKTARFIKPYHDYTGQTAPTVEPSDDLPIIVSDEANLYAPDKPQPTPGFRHYDNAN